MAKRRTPKSFKPQVFSFEDRVVPAAYFVDNAFAGKANGAIVTFNAGQSNQVTGLVIGTNAFAFFGDAITKANGDAAADTITFANGTFDINQTTNAGAFLITNPLDFIGSGKAVTILDSKQDTVDASGTNGALFAAQNTTFNVSNLTLDAGGVLTASGFRYESSKGTVNNTTIQNVQDLSGGVSAGYGVVAVDTSNVTVSGSSLITNGRGGVRFDNGATGSVKGSTLQGRGGTGPTSIDFGVDITDGSSALVTGNVISGFLGSVPSVPGPGVDETSAAIQVASAVAGKPSSASVFGNTLDTNFTGVIVGIGGGDASNANIQFNNITNNTVVAGDPGSGIFTDTTGKVTALNNFWGTAAGPQASDNPGGNPGSSINNIIVTTYKDATITQPPQGIATDKLPVQVVNTPAEAAAGASPTVTITGPAAPTNAPITLTVVFSEAVTGFAAADVVLTGTAGTGTVTSVTTTDNKTFSVVVGGLNKRGTLTATIAAGSSTDSSGIGNAAGTANIAFQPVFDRGFAAAGDAGITSPVIGVPDTFTPTRFNQTVFGAAFTGGERVASADVNGDGTLDYIVASGPGITTEVRVFNGLNNAQIFSIQPFGAFTRGAYVSAGDLTGDGLAEVIISAERGGGARIRIFSPNAAGAFNQTSDFIGLIGSTGVADNAFRGGSRTAVGDMNGDGRNDLIFAAGTGGGPRIALFNGLTLGSNGGPKLSGDFFVFDTTLRNGSYVAAGNINADNKAELIVGAGNGASRVRVIEFSAILANTAQVVSSIADYFAFGSTGGGGVRVAAEDLDGDGKADVIAGNGPGGASSIRTYNNVLGNPANPAVSKELNLFGNFTGGVFVG